MRLLPASLFLAALLLSSPGPAAAELDDGDPIGYSLDDDWNEWWRQIVDRHGRPDPIGPIQQRFDRRLYQKYEADLLLSFHPIHLEQAWTLADNGARFWVHSFDANELGTKVQMKFSRPMSRNWQYRMRYDKLYNKSVRSDLVRIEFAWDPPGDGPYTSLAFFPRFEKQDSDFEGTVGYRRRELGDARIRLFVLDAFANGSYGLAVRRPEPPDGLFKHESLPLAVAAEVATRRWRGLRTELYAGRVLPQKKRVFFDELTRDRIQEESATLLGGLLEWRAESLPLWIGATGMSVGSRYQTDGDEVAGDRRVRERTVQTALYAFAIPRDGLVLETRVRRSSYPETEELSDPLIPTRVRKDRSWIFSQRAYWMISDVAGVDLSYWFRTRRSSGEPDVNVDGRENRFVTRALLRLGTVWAAFGIGWRLDPGETVYAGGGGSVIIEFD